MNAPSIAFVSFADGGFVPVREKLIASIQAHHPHVPIFPFGACDEIRSPAHEENPYAFKVYAIKSVEAAGHDIVLWCDSPLRLVKPIDSLTHDIETRGVFLQQAGWRCGQWANDDCLRYFAMTRDEAMRIPSISASFMAFDFRRPVTRVFFRQWTAACEAGAFKGSWKNGAGTESSDPRCLGHRHDQTCAEIISHRLGIPRGFMVCDRAPDHPQRYFTTWDHA